MTAFDDDPGLVTFFEASGFDNDAATFSPDPGDLDLFWPTSGDLDAFPLEAAFLSSDANCCFFAKLPKSRPIPVLALDWVVFSAAFLASLTLL